MPDKEKLNVITEIGDMGLGVFPITEDIESNKKEEKDKED